MKILFCGTHPGLSTGYAKVANSIVNTLARTHRVYHIAFQAVDRVDRFVNPNVNMINVPEFGYDVIQDTVQDINPDVIIVYNDVIVCSHYINKLKELEKTFKVFLYLDLTYKYQSYIPPLAEYADQIVCFNKSWERHLNTLGIWNTCTIEHQLDAGGIHKTDKSKSVIGLNDDDFIVLNLNRNSYRKCLDITMDGFIKFFKKNDCNEHLKLFMACKYNYSGSYDIMQLAQTYAKINGLDEEQTNTLIYKCILRTQADDMTSEHVNNIYNSCDVGINTCCGEGYGLCNIEHQLTGKPQVLTGIDNFKELFDESWCMFVDPVARLHVPTDIDGVGGIMEIPSSDDVAQALNFYFKNPEIRKKMGMAGREHFLNKDSDLTKWLNLLSM